MGSPCLQNQSQMITKNKGGRPQKEDLLEGLVNLDTGLPAEFKPSPYFPSMKAAAHALKMDIAILRDARSRDCPAFRSGGVIHREQLEKWLKENPQTSLPQDEGDLPEDDFEENYSPPDETGGVGQTLKSLQAYERRAKRILDEAERSTKLAPSVKADRVKAARDAWLKVVNSLLKYDLAVDMAKRESGELLPIADAIKAVQSILAWHTVAISDALRNVIPECEGKNKYEIAATLDPVLRSSIYRNFKLGIKLGKIPEWAGKSASEFVKAEDPLSLDTPTPSTNLEEY